MLCFLKSQSFLELRDKVMTALTQLEQIPSFSFAYEKAKGQERKN
jgi:hypothetical protein